jgi:hypothetical protein
MEHAGKKKQRSFVSRYWILIVIVLWLIVWSARDFLEPGAEAVPEEEATGVAAVSGEVSAGNGEAETAGRTGPAVDATAAQRAETAAGARPEGTREQTRDAARETEGADTAGGVREEVRDQPRNEVSGEARDGDVGGPADAMDAKSGAEDPNEPRAEAAAKTTPAVATAAREQGGDEEMAKPSPVVEEEAGAQDRDEQAPSAAVQEESRNPGTVEGAAAGNQEIDAKAPNAGGASTTALASAEDARKEDPSAGEPGSAGPADPASEQGARHADERTEGEPLSEAEVARKAQAALTEGRDAFWREGPQAAAEVLRSALAEMPADSPQRADLYGELGNVLYRGGNVSGAMEAWENALPLLPAADQRRIIQRLAPLYRRHDPAGVGRLMQQR